PFTERHGVRSLQNFTVIAIAVLSLIAHSAAAEPPARWVYLMTNLQVNENVPQAEALLRRAAKAGYNGVLLADYKLNILDRVPEHYFANARRFKATADELGLEIIPGVAPFGYSEGILAHDLNLAEGLPARDVPLRVQGRQAAIDSVLTDALPGGTFEERRGQTFVGWDFQDEPGKMSFIDTQVRHGGASSLRFDDPAKNNPQSGNARVSKLIKVHPWGQYHASIWIKTQGFETAHDVHMFALSPSGRKLSHSNLGVKRDQDWTEHHIVFNSLDNDEVRFYVGAWSGRMGKLWLDDARLEETAFVNLLRRPGCPLKIAGEDGTVYQEGRDYAELRDPRMGTVPWQGGFEVYHEPPKLTLTAGSHIKDGQKLRASFYHAVTIYDNQVPCSLAEPRVFEVLKDQVERVEKLLRPKTYMMSHDEIRVANWTEDENRPGRTAGELLAENVRRCVEVVRQVNPQARLCFWSDMFDPHHNAVKDFFLVNGDLAGSWEGLPRDAIIINWNSAKPRESLPFFAHRGHKQILAGYYDGSAESIRPWLTAGKGLSGIDGAMYTTWRHNYDALEAFAKYAWGTASGDVVK
ncbi:MAG TPA: hypothetical protein VJ783_19380, partial [Pirellulales bacterium]|nr:hypothetical protein [Pirellulales bacterium]